MNNDKKKILAIDLGYGAIKCCDTDSYGAVRFERIINAVAKLPTAPLEMDDESVFRFLDDYYILGPTALLSPRENIVEVKDWESLKKVYPIWLSYLVKKYAGDAGFSAFDKIAIGLSLAFMNKGDELLEYIYEELLFPPDKRDLFIVLPQGTAARVAYEHLGTALRDTDKANVNNTKFRNYIIVDQGALTSDIVAITNGKSSSSGNIGIENSGAISICFKIIDYIYQNFGGLKISIKEAMSVLETGTFIRRRVTYNLQPQVDIFCKEFIRDSLKLLEDRMSSSLDVAEGILMIGGCANIWKKYKDEPDVKSEIEQHFPVSFIMIPDSDPEHYNSRAYLLITQKLMEEGKI